jgi:hypothetical protein
MKDLLTDEEISKVLDIEEESDVFSEESDDFWFDTSEEDSERDSDTSSIVHESEPCEEVSEFSQAFVPHGMAHQRFAFLGVSGVNVDFDDETSVLECFQKFIDEDIWQLFTEQTNIYANQFLAANPNLKPRSQARSWKNTNPSEMKTLIGLLILQGIVQKPENGMYFSKSESIVTPYFSQIMTEKCWLENVYYQKMFRYLLDVVCLNAFIIYKKESGSISRLDFLLTLAESLSSISGVVEPATRGLPSKSPKPS